MAQIRKPFFVLPLDLGTMVCSAAVAGHPVFNLNRHKAIGLTWQADATEGLWARGALPAPASIDFAAMVSANAQPGTYYRIRLGDTQAQVDGGAAPYDSGPLPFISPAITREDGLYHSHLELPLQTARWWRIDVSGHLGTFEASQLVLGQKREPSRFYNFDWEYGVKDLGDLTIGPWGVMDEQPGLIFRTLSFTLAWQSEAEFEGVFRPLIERVGRRGIIYCAFDPEPTAYRQARTFMGVFDKPPFAKGVRKPRTFTQDFVITSMI
ncbi:hypothetical protein [Novosphingobium sp.]|uniref:hypothetical protein n=1 Tax=Novosphingobium sp. TaxID=1874826 RepID=UPI002FDE9BDD